MRKLKKKSRFQRLYEKHYAFGVSRKNYVKRKGIIVGKS